MDPVPSARLVLPRDSRFCTTGCIHILTIFQYDAGTHDVEIPLSEADLWPSGHMKVSRTKPDTPLSKLDITSPTYTNMNTAWWDGSQIYGSSEAMTSELRGSAFHGKLAMKKDGREDFLLRDASNLPLTGFNQNCKFSKISKASKSCLFCTDQHRVAWS